MRIEYHSNSDSQGRCRFALYWMSDYHPGDPRGEYRTAERGQYFFADPRKHGFARPEEAAGKPQNQELLGHKMS